MTSKQILAAIAIVVTLGIAGGMDMQDQLEAEARAAACGL